MLASKISLAWLLVALVGCERASGGHEPPRGDASNGVSPAAAPGLAPLGTRAESVARADALAVAAGTGGGASILQLQEAALIRTRLYRREHREADALEAMELERQVARVAGPARCEAELRRTLLEAELRNDPVGTYGSLYGSSLGAAPGCRTKFDAALAMLEGFRPASSVLDEIERGRSPAPRATGPSNVVPTEPPGVAETATLTRIERYAAADAARVVVFLSKPVRFEVGALPAGDGNGSRLFVDLRGASYGGKATLSAGGLVQRVRVSEKAADARVVLDLRAEVEHRVFYVPEPFRLVIDVAKRDGLRQATRDVRRVVLDPGHGGQDPGATGPTGLREKDVALDIAHRAAPLIARELGISTLLTRDADVFVPLEERTARANAFGADLFISIHCNATERGGSSGVMTFVLDDAKDQLASRIAALENAASPQAASELASTMSRFGDRTNDERSSEFAELLQRAALASLAPSYPDVPDGGVKRAGFYVLAGARMPAVLFETSFISSARDETRFNTGDFRQKLADAIVNAVRAYRANAYKDGRARPARPGP